MDLFSPEVLGAFLSGVIGPIMLHWIKTKLDLKKEKQKDLVKESLKTNIQVENKIDEILNKFNADRVYVKQFHNGGNYHVSNRSIQKFSMVYETSKLGINSIQQYFQNIPISLFGKLINELSEQEILSIPDYGDTEFINKYNLESVKDISQNKSEYLFTIRSIDGKFIGILGVDYINKKKTLTQWEISHIALEVSTISGALMNIIKNKNNK